MRNYVIINGVNSTTIQGLAINILPPITKPLIRTQIEEIDGRDGDLVTELGYSAYDKQMEIGLWGTYDIDAIIKYFTGEGTIVFSTEPDKYYYFKILNQIDYEKLLKFKKATVTFHCQPYKYPTSETPLEEQYEYVEATGTDLTLNNTEETIFNKFDLKGNTYQDSTTGKNLFSGDFSQFDSTGGEGTTYGYFKLPKANTRYTLTVIAKKDFTPTNYTYLGFTGNGGNAQAGYYWIVAGNMETFVKGSTKSIGNLYGGNILEYVSLFNNNEQTLETFNEYFDIQLEEGTTATEYEPYTNGASPNPDYPQQVHTVSGDNTINVTGKNLFGLKQWLDYFGATYTENNDGSITFKTQTNLYNTTYPIKETDRCMWSYKITNETGTNFRFQYMYEDGSTTATSGSGSGTSEVSVSTSSSVPTAHGSVIGIRANWSTTGTFTIRECMLEKLIEGTSPQPYEPFGKEYPVNLGVVNLLPTNSFTLTKGTNRTLQINFPTPIPEGTYTLSCKIKNASGLTSSNGMAWALYDGSVTPAVSSAIFTQIIDTTTSPYSSTKTTTRQSTHLYIYLQNALDDSATITIEELQLEQRDRASSFSPYGTTPIELCKIGNYQDKFIRNSGKNLLEPSSFAQKVIDTPYSSANVSTYDSETGELSIKMGNGSVVFDNFKENTQYTIILKYNIATNGSNLQISYTDNTTQNITPTAGSGIFRLVTTEGKSVASIKHSAYDSTTPRTLYLKESGIFEGGIETTDFEPYGNGDWYLEKKIGKIDLGDAYYVTNTSSQALGKYYKFYAESYNFLRQGSYYETAYQMFCETYRSVRRRGTDVTSGTFFADGTTTNVTEIQFKNDDIATATDFKNSMSGKHLYYPIATPTYTKIEGTLKDQLNALSGAKSYNSQTNITQTNNDMPFILDVSALKDGSDHLIIDNIGTAYSKPTIDIDGTGIVDIYLNDEQIFEIDLTTQNEIIIDTEKMEAYTPDNTLANRLVTGDYSNFKLAPGENDLRFSGDLTKATVTRYIRWI